MTGPSATVRRALAVLAVLELLTVATLLTNLATAHLRPITQIVGPVHGAIYLTIIVTVLIARGLRPVERILGCLPIVGGTVVGILFARRSSGRVQTPTRNEDTASREPGTSR